MKSLFIFLALLLSTVKAAEPIFLSGVMCRAVEGSQLNRIDAVKSNPHGIISRGHSTSRKKAVSVTCPIPKIGKGDATSIKVFLNHPIDRKTRCSVSRSEIKTGENTVRTATFEGSGDRTGEFGDFIDAKPTDTYVLTCLLSENTILRGYSWTSRIP